MKKYATCPDCGHKLCKAEPGSLVDISCPQCKKWFTIEVGKDTVITKATELKKAT